MKIKLETQYEVGYKGVTITIERRIVDKVPRDWGYRTSNGISGIGQSSAQQAERDAKKAIDAPPEDQRLRAAGSSELPGLELPKAAGL